MKKILIGLLFVIINIYSAHAPEIRITCYIKEYLEEITKIAFQNPNELFEQYKPEEHDEFLKYFQSTFQKGNIIKVILENDTVVGYIKICIRIEPCLALIKNFYHVQGIVCPKDDILLQENPCLKIVINNLQNYVSIDQDFHKFTEDLI